MSRSSLVATALAVLLVPAVASAADPAVEAGVMCAVERGLTGLAWCQVAQSFAAERKGDLRGALTLADTAAPYLAKEGLVQARTISLRARLGSRLPGYGQEAVHRCNLAGAAAIRADFMLKAACRLAWRGALRAKAAPVHVGVSTAP